MQPPSVLTLDQIDRQLRGLAPGLGGNMPNMTVTDINCQFNYRIDGRRCFSEMRAGQNGEGVLRTTVVLGHVPFSAEGAVARDAAKTLLSEIAASRHRLKLHPNARGDIELIDERNIDSPVTAEGLLQAVVEFISETRPWIQLLTTYLADATRPAPRKTRLC